jgi:hypothetical protein
MAFGGGYHTPTCANLLLSALPSSEAGEIEERLECAAS